MLKLFSCFRPTDNVYIRQKNTTSSVQAVVDQWLKYDPGGAYIFKSEMRLSLTDAQKGHYCLQKEICAVYPGVTPSKSGRERVFAQENDQGIFMGVIKGYHGEELAQYYNECLPSMFFDQVIRSADIYQTMRTVLDEIKGQSQWIHSHRGQKVDFALCFISTLGRVTAISQGKCFAQIYTKPGMAYCCYPISLPEDQSLFKGEADVKGGDYIAIGTRMIKGGVSGMLELVEKSDDKLKISPEAEDFSLVVYSVGKRGYNAESKNKDYSM